MDHPRAPKSLRILTLCYEYPPVGGGGGRVAAQVASALTDRGHEVRVQTAGMKGLPGRETRDGVEIFRTHSFRKKRDTCTVIEMGLYVLTSLIPTLRHLRQWKPHVVHVHFAVPTGALAWAATRIFRVPYLLTAHLGDVPGGVPAQTSSLFAKIMPFTRPIWRDAADVTAVSTFVGRLANAAYQRNPRVIFNGIRLGQPPSIKIGSPPKIIFAGRMSIQKNPALAIEALAKADLFGWAADFVGDGPLLDRAKSLARQYGIQSRITFHGWTDGEKVRELLGKADILLMTSSSEGLPMIGVEALAAGLAIVSTRIDGMADIVEEHQNGLFVSADEGAEGIASALSALLSNPALLKSMRLHGARKVLQFGLEKSVSDYEAAIFNIL